MVLPMTLPRFDLRMPANLDEAVAALAEAGGDARPLAGGTDLIVKMKRGDLKPPVVVSLSRLEGLDDVVPTEDGTIRVGALTTMTRLSEHPLLLDGWTALSEGAAVVGGPLIRNRATVGGNICNARPCADTVPPMLAHGATLHIASTRGTRTVALEGFITGPGEASIAPDELLTHIEIPDTRDVLAGSAYVKFTRRAVMEVTLVGCAAFLRLDDAGTTIEEARIALTSVASTPVRVPRAEIVLRGAAPDDEVLAEAARLARDSVQPIDDHRTTAAWRSQVVEVGTRRMLVKARERALGRQS